MYYYTIVFILSFNNFFYLFGQNFNDPDYYPPQINPNTDPIRRYLKLWSGILRNVAGDSEPNYNYQQNNNIRDFQQNNYHPTSYNDDNQRPFENLLKTWKNRIEEISLTPKSLNEGIPLNQLKNNINNDQKNYVSSFSNIKNNNEKGIINEMLLHKLLPRNKGDMYAFTSTTSQPSTTTITNELSNTKKSKSHKKSAKKNSNKINSNLTLSLNNSNIGKDYKAKVKIGPIEELEKSTITSSTDTTTLETDIEGSGEEITNNEKENNLKTTMDSEEDDTSEVEEIIENENDINKKNVDNLDNDKNLSKLTNEVLVNSTNTENFNNTTEVDKKNIETKDRKYNSNDNSEYIESSEEQNNLHKNNTILKNTTLEHDNLEDYNDVEYSSEEEEISSTTELITTTTLLTTTTTQKNKNINNLKNKKQNKKQKSPTSVNVNKKNNQDNKNKTKIEKNEVYTIPEAEEEEDFLLPKHLYASQIDSLPETDTSSTTKASPSQPQSVYNFYTNANANSTPNNSNTVVPVNTMVDGILPLLIPLLASRTPYLQNMLDNLAYGVKTNKDFLPIKNDTLTTMSNNRNNNHEEDKHLLSPIDKKFSNAIDSLKKSIDKNVAFNYLSSVIPKQISNTNNGKDKQYYKTIVPEKSSNKDEIPWRPTKL